MGRLYLFRGWNMAVWHMWGIMLLLCWKDRDSWGLRRRLLERNEHFTRSTKAWTLWCSGWYSGRQISILGHFQELFRVGPLQISGGSVWEGLNSLKCAPSLTLGWDKNGKKRQFYVYIAIFITQLLNDYFGYLSPVTLFSSVSGALGASLLDWAGYDVAHMVVMVTRWLSMCAGRIASSVWYTTSKETHLRRL